MKVVVEFVLIENFLINFIILKTCCLILKEKGKFLLLSSFFCACICVCLPALRLNAVGHVLIELGQIALSICLCFKFKTVKKFATIFATYLVCAFVYGGMCHFAQNIFGMQSILILLFIVSMAFVVVSFTLKKVNQKRAISNFCFHASVTNNGKTVKFDAFLDSGNLLFDPLTNQPVTLINFRVFSALFPEISIEDIFRKSEKLNILTCAHHITLNTLSSGEKILVFQADQLQIGENKIEKPMLGLCLKGFNSAFGTDIILHNNFAKAC